MPEPDQFKVVEAMILKIKTLEEKLKEKEQDLLLE
ncbi:hypothetical protein M7I_2394 [Glarea lozoyensis 74030]|uniref:Uncharacterized protein n=1 Tax=Glarea lozoyensis (strain ATCC 74030 / MF5533) TaxID=1104152 RepID=H0EIN4_GLAL7|nr:hypothetical protein M7I_2394 [Glarea lozoyensis 74030]